MAAASWRVPSWLTAPPYRIPSSGKGAAEVTWLRHLAVRRPRPARGGAGLGWGRGRGRARPRAGRRWSSAAPPCTAPTGRARRTAAPSPSTGNRRAPVPPGHGRVGPPPPWRTDGRQRPAPHARTGCHPRAHTHAHTHDTPRPAQPRPTPPDSCTPPCPPLHAHSCLSRPRPSRPRTQADLVRARLASCHPQPPRSRGDWCARKAPAPEAGEEPAAGKAGVAA